MTREEILGLVSQMTLEEKAGMCSGRDAWNTKALKRLGVPSVMMTDGPHGLRKQAEGEGAGVYDSVRAVCFPAGCALAASFDRRLLMEVGRAIGENCRKEGVGILLGPAINIKRSPLCGRNFEYYSEDPHLSGELAAEFVRGVQQSGVGACLKHYLANNQETRRMSVSAELDERTLREIYLAAFEIPVKKVGPWAVMCSYNRVNGRYVAESKKFLTDILRGEWGFDGFVVSDWGAVNDRVPDLEAGLDLEMPFSGGERDAEIAEAVGSGRLDESVLDTAVERILTAVLRASEKRGGRGFDAESAHRLAVRAASECAVLLKNDGVLPIREGARVAFIGRYAESPRYQGGGSSHVNAWRVESALERAPESVVYEPGYDESGTGTSEELLGRAAAAAASADVAVVFAGLPEAWESEGFDRKHMRLPEAQNALIERVAESQPNVVVVLHNGAPVEMPWLGRVRGLLELYLGGEGAGAAAVDILFGRVNPSGRLPETFPRKLEDNPSFLNFPGEGDRVCYREGVFVGYRYYDKKRMDVLFPFGFGLSYTSFEYSNLRLSAAEIRDDEELTASVDVKNAGGVFGKEVVQLYVAPKGGEAIRPVKELRGFDKVALFPGETKTVTFTLGKRAFAYYCEDLGDWRVESGEYDVIIARSAAEPVLAETVRVESTASVPRRYTADTILLDVRKDPRAMRILEPLLKAHPFLGGEGDGGAAEMWAAMADFLPLRGLVGFGGITREDIRRLVERLNCLEGPPDGQPPNEEG